MCVNKPRLLEAAMKKAPEYKEVTPPSNLAQSELQWKALTPKEVINSTALEVTRHDVTCPANQSKVKSQEKLFPQLRPNIPMRAAAYEDRTLEVASMKAKITKLLSKGKVWSSKTGLNQYIK